MILEVLDLTWEINLRTLAQQYVHDNNDRTPVCINHPTNSSYINICQLMMVNTSNVHGTVGFK